MKLLKSSHCQLRKDLLDILGGYEVRPTANWVLKKYVEYQNEGLTEGTWIDTLARD